MRRRKHSTRLESDRLTSLRGPGKLWSILQRLTPTLEPENAPTELLYTRHLVLAVNAYPPHGDPPAAANCPKSCTVHFRGLCDSR